MYQSVFFYLICIVISLLLLLELWKYYLSKTILKNYGSFRGYPIVGVIPYLINLDNEKFISVINSWCDSVEEKPFYIFLGHLLFCFVEEPEDFKVILNSKNSLDKGYLYECLSIGSSLLVIFLITF